jgi:hypothetical protein
VTNVLEVCSIPMNGHHPAAVACQFCANSGSRARYSVTSSAFTPDGPGRSPEAIICASFALRSVDQRI